MFFFRQIKAGKPIRIGAVRLPDGCHGNLGGHNGQASRALAYPAEKFLFTTDLYLHVRC